MLSYLYDKEIKRYKWEDPDGSTGMMNTPVANIITNILGAEELTLTLVSQKKITREWRILPMIIIILIKNIKTLPQVTFNSKGHLNINPFCLNSL